MFPQRYFPIRYFTPLYWPPGFVPAEIEIEQVIDFILAITQHLSFDLSFGNVYTQPLEIQPWMNFVFTVDPADVWTKRVEEVHEFYLAMCQMCGVDLGITDYHNIELPMKSEDIIALGMKPLDNVNLKTSQSKNINLETKQLYE